MYCFKFHNTAKKVYSHILIWVNRTLCIHAHAYVFLTLTGVYSLMSLKVRTLRVDLGASWKQRSKRKRVEVHIYACARMWGNQLICLKVYPPTFYDLPLAHFFFFSFFRFTAQRADIILSTLYCGFSQFNSGQNQFRLFSPRAHWIFMVMRARAPARVSCRK